MADLAEVIQFPMEVEEEVGLTSVPVHPPYINRELSWLDFNERVLRQTGRKDIPDEEKLNFLGISASNLDEFISVRFAEAYKKSKEESKDELGQDIPYEEILEGILTQKKQQMATLGTMFINSFLPPVNDLSVLQKKKFQKIFEEDIIAGLTPIRVSSNKEVPIFYDEDINFFVELLDDEEKTYCFIQIPYQMSRVFRDGDKFYLVEDLVRSNMNEIFNSKTVTNYAMFKVVKNYNEEVAHDASVSIVDRVDKILKLRRTNNIIFMDVVVFNDESEKLVKRLTKLLHVPKKHIMYFRRRESHCILGMQFLKSYPFRKVMKDFLKNNMLWNRKFKPKVPEELLGESSLFSYLDEDDLIVIHPYETYDVVVGFLKEAANDSKVIAIKQTLYRVSSKKSPIVEALCEAAKRGVKVTVMLELLARFDEMQNLSLIKTLKSAGCNVVYSLEEMKTHCKISLVVRATKKGLTLYSHCGTGNYNEKTARIYTDISYFTSRSSIGHDLNSIFNMITGFSHPENMKMVSYSPDTLQAKIIDEMRLSSKWAADNNKSVTIKLKVNAICDLEVMNVINEIYESNPLVHFKIICRGVCSLRSKERIEIKSIVGRFLEHSRIYIFEHDEKIFAFISSADLLTRNLKKRIETLIPITRKSCRDKVIRHFDTLWLDTSNTKYMTIDENKFIDVEGAYKNAQNEFTM